MRIDELIDLELLKISHRYVNKTIPKPMGNLFQANDYNHNYLTRARNNPRIEWHSSNIFHKSFLCRAPSYGGMELTHWLIYISSFSGRGEKSDKLYDCPLISANQSSPLHLRYDIHYSITERYITQSVSSMPPYHWAQLDFSSWVIMLVFDGKKWNVFVFWAIIRF